MEKIQYLISAFSVGRKQMKKKTSVSSRREQT